MAAGRHVFLVPNLAFCFETFKLKFMKDVGTTIGLLQ